MANIEDGVPLPRRKYPWKLMKPGQSFTVKTSKERDNALHVARTQMVKATSKKLRKGYRLWRTA